MKDPLTNKFSFRKYYQTLNGVGKKADFTIAPQPTKQMVDFYLWLNHVGIKTPASIHYPAYFKSPEGYSYPGILAMEDIKPNEILWEIPSKALINTRNAYCSDLYPFFSYYVTVFSPKSYIWDYTVIYLFMKYEQLKGLKSQWYPYLQVLPKDTNTPTNWTENEINEMQDKRFIEYVFSEKKEILACWDELESVIKNFPNLFPHNIVNIGSFTEFWALSSSRCFCSKARLSTFAPYADFVNHENVDSFYSNLYIKEVPANTQPDEEFYSENSESDIDLNNNSFDDSEPIIYPHKVLNEPINASSPQGELLEIEKLLKGKVYTDEEKESLTAIDDLMQKDESYTQIYSTGSVKYEKGSQLYMAYGNKSNKHLLHEYGFILPNNKFDIAPIYIDVIKKYKNADEIEKALKSANYEKPEDIKCLYDYQINVLYDKLSTSTFIIRTNSLKQSYSWSSKSREVYVI